MEINNEYNSIENILLYKKIHFTVKFTWIFLKTLKINEICTIFSSILRILRIREFFISHTTKLKLRSKTCEKLKEVCSFDSFSSAKKKFYHRGKMRDILLTKGEKFISLMDVNHENYCNK